MLRTCFGYTVRGQYVLERNWARFDFKLIVGAVLNAILEASSLAQQAVITPLTATATPVFSPAAGTYPAAERIVIKDATRGAAIYYTTNGDTPSTASTPYTGPIAVNSTETVKAIAVAAGYTESTVESALYSITTPTVSARLFYSFGNSGVNDGSYPSSPVVVGSDGYLYGTTPRGVGSSGLGVVFKISPRGVETVLHVFTGGESHSTDGVYPYAAVVEASDGYFYGTTFQGGAYNRGTVFKVSSSGVESVVYSFGAVANDGDGEGPDAALIQASDGNLYGTTQGGGVGGGGTVFRITLAGAESTVYSFGLNSGDGVLPVAALVEGTDGYLYGTTRFGGAKDSGTVFKVSSSGSETVLHSFVGQPSDGAQPGAPLIQASDGFFYGTTGYGGAYSNNAFLEGCGSVFKIDAAGAETVLHSFGCQTGDGLGPAVSALVEGSNGNFYGTTGYRGINGAGAVFKITPAGVESILCSFLNSADTEGYSPAGLTLGAGGVTFTTANLGGAHGIGSVLALKHVLP